MSGRSVSVALGIRSVYVAAIALVCASGPQQSASAQSVDYGALESLFGEAVTTSATGSPQRVTEVPANMIIVTADEIRRSGATDVPSVLRHVAGIDILQWGTDNADVSVRGYDQAFSPRLLVLIDGRQVYADYYGFTPWFSLPVELAAIRQIEIVKGPNCALFGFNAVAGVINIITYNPLNDNVNAASASVGTQGFKQGSAVTTFRLGEDAAFRLSAGGQSDQDFSTAVPILEAGVPRRDNDRVAADLDGTMRLDDRTELRLDVTHSDAHLNEMDPAYAFGYSRYATNSVRGQILADTGFGLLKFSTYTNWIDEEATVALNPAPWKLSSEVTVVQAEDLVQLNNDNALRASLEYRHDSMGTAPLSGGSVSYDVFSSSLMWAWNINSLLSFTSAGRADDLELSRTGFTPPGYPLTNADWNRSTLEFSYNLGLVWKVDDDNTLRVLASRGVQAPSLTDSGGLLVVSPYYDVTGIPSLKLTDVQNYEFDWDFNWTTLDTKLRAALFHQDSFDLLAVTGGFLVSPTAFYSTPTNVGNSHANGAEFSASGVISGGWTWRLSERAEFVTDRLLPFAGGASYTDFDDTTPRHLANANLGWSDTKWEIDGFLRFQSATSGIMPAAPAGSILTPIPAYAALDARVGYRLWDWATVAISGQNLLTSTQRQTSGPAVERRVFGTVSVTF